MSKTIGPFEAQKHQHKDGSGLNSFQIHRLWQQVLMDCLTYGPTYPTKMFQQFTREQLQFIASAAESFGAICYDAGYYYAKPDDSGKAG